MPKIKNLVGCEAGERLHLVIHVEDTPFDQIVNIDDARAYLGYMLDELLALKEQLLALLSPVTSRQVATTPSPNFAARISRAMER